MWSFFVVLLEPLLSLFAHLCQALKHKHVEHRLTVATIESLDESVLHRPPWLDKLELHAVLLRPISECHRKSSGPRPSFTMEHYGAADDDLLDEACDRRDAVMTKGN